MKLLSTLLPISFLAFAACSGSGSTAAVGIQHGDSTGTPLPGSTVGNWELESISVIKDTGAPHSMQVGMNLRLSKTGLEVLLDEYVGPGTMLPDVLQSFYGGTYAISQLADPEKGFEATITLDFSPFFGAKLGSFFNTIYAKGTLVGEKMQVEYLFREHLLLNNVVTEVSRDELGLVFRKGNKVELTPGNWDVDKVIVLADTSPTSPLLFPAPIPKRVAVGAKLAVGATEVSNLFGGPISKGDFLTAFPEFLIQFQDGHVGNAVAQGFMAIEGKKGMKYDNQGAVVEFNFFHTGATLVGAFKGAWAADLGKSPTHLYHVYVTLSPAKLLTSSLADGSGAEDLVDLAAIDLSTDVFGVTDPDALRTRLESYGVVLPASR